MKRSKRLNTGNRASGNLRTRLGRQDWIDAARDELIAKGVSAVKVGRLAKLMRVTRGGFYWHFHSHAELLRELLRGWEETNTRPFERVLEKQGVRFGTQEFLHIVNLWVEERDYSPAFDTAVRDWARISKDAAAAVRRADDRRIAVLHRVFLDLGFPNPEAEVRARITYFHQVGYYALELHEDRERRLSLVPVYAQVLLGRASEMIQAAYSPGHALDTRLSFPDNGAQHVPAQGPVGHREGVRRRQMRKGRD